MEEDKNSGSEEKTLILTIDDEEALRESFSDFLLDRGYEVIQAADGKEGLEMVELHQPDLILCDLRMPEIDGLEVVKSVAADRPDTPIIVVSGAGVMEDAMEAVRLGAWDYLVKPIYNLNILLKAVEKAFERAELIARNRAYQVHLEEQTRKLAHEIKERKMAEEELVRSEKLAALGDLVAGVAHEINTPVGIGVTAVSHLNDITAKFKRLFLANEAKRSDLEVFLEECEEACSVTMANLRRAARLVSSFKKVAVDQTSDEKRAFEMESYFREILLSLRPKVKKTNHEILLDCPEPITIDSYPGVFSQIITNLVINSFQHGFDGVERGIIRISIHREGKMIQIRYTDNGRGMEPDQIEKIFDPFFTTRRGRGGTGLGMHLVYNLVKDRLKGKIECRSTPDQGTEFIIQVPETLKSNPDDSGPGK
ncbi:response regulator [Desulfospira joergensenii]|uniref:response regulator n=1 Tax=Desulfospira joergensenii TaxID=53329 RepID=UPI0003B4A3C8|nr:response regulator [Desulfospira joergensenii]